MSRRFFSADLITGDGGEIVGAEAHHLLHVLRCAIGDRISVFDGDGAEFCAEITSTTRKSVEFSVLQRCDVDRELPFQLTLGVALPKGDRQKWLVEKLTEIGVTRLVPLVTERGVAQPTCGAHERLKRCVIEACKQCGRNCLMEIEDATPWPDFLRCVADPADEHWSASLTPEAKKVLIAHPGAKSAADALHGTKTDRVVAVGPEGGFTAAEIALAEATGAQLISLGPRILRVETAAISLASILTLST